MLSEVYYYYYYSVKITYYIFFFPEGWGDSILLILLYGCSTWSCTVNENLHCVLKQVTVGREHICTGEKDGESCIARSHVIHYTIQAMLFPCEITVARNT